MSTLKDFNLVIRNQNTQQYLTDVLGDRKSTFVTNLTAIVNNDKKLQECVPVTLMYAALKATSLGLKLGNEHGHCYVIPYKDHRTGKVEAQFQLGYLGYFQLARKSGKIQKINATDVREGELVSTNRLEGTHKWAWIDNDEERNSKPVIGYASWILENDGYSHELYMTVEELKAHGLRYSQTYSSRNENVRNTSKWATDFDAMAKKTMLKMILKKWSLTSCDENMYDAIRADQSVQREANQYTYVDNEKGNAKAKLSDLAEEQIQEAEAEEVVEPEKVEEQSNEETE